MFTLFIIGIVASKNFCGIPYRGKVSYGKNLVTSEKLATFPRLIIQIRHFSPTNF